MTGHYTTHKSSADPGNHNYKIYNVDNIIIDKLIFKTLTIIILLLLIFLDCNKKTSRQSSRYLLVLGNHCAQR